MTLTELAKQEHILTNGARLLSFELVLIELMRQRRSDANMRDALGTTQGSLISAILSVRGKFDAPLSESLVEAAERHGIPRLDLT